MTIKKLKELIKNLPDNMRVYADDGSKGMFSDNSEFLILAYTENKNDMCVLQTRNDFNTNEELEAMCNYFAEENYEEQDFWIDFYETGYHWWDFDDEERREWAKEQLENYGLD